MADRAAAFVHITTLISLSIVCAEWERHALCVCEPQIACLLPACV